MTVLLPSKPTGLANNIGNGSNTTNNNNTYITNLSVGDSSVSVTDNNTPNTNVSLITNNKIGIYVNDTQRIGININTPTKRLVINDELGETIRLIYNKAVENKFADINIDSNGSLIFKTYDNQYINFIDSTNTSTPNIKLNNQILYASANQLNYTTISTPGIAESNKVVVLDNNRSINNINAMRLNELTVDDLYLNDELRINVDTIQYGLQINNNSGNCLKLQNNNHFTLFNIQSTGVLSIYNNTNIIEILSDKNNNLIYPIQLTTENNLNITGIGIKFNTYNNDNIKRNMSSIETIITNNQNNNENSIIKFNNMNNGNLTNTVTIRNDGYILCNTLMELSDRRTKYIINNSNFEESLEKISKINTYNFIYKNDSKKIIHKGLIAQELYDIIPSAIHIENANDLKDLYTISNKELIGYLIDCIKALKYKIENFKTY